MPSEALARAWIRHTIGPVTIDEEKVAFLLHNDVFHLPKNPTPEQLIAASRSRQEGVQTLGLPRVRKLRESHTHPHSLR